MIDVLLVEDNQIVRTGLCNLLAEREDMRVVGQAENGLEALSLLRKGLQVQVIVADINMPVMDGFELTTNVAAEYPQLPVIMLTMHDKAVFIERALQAGARGYLLKSGDITELFKAIIQVSEGKSYYPN
jgi:DNA-binding NarL/FixJ family response regulator